MASENALWGAERIRGELLKLGIRVAKRTVQRHMRSVRRRPGGGQRWQTFVHNHASQIWACDFLQVHDIWFRAVFALFMMKLDSREIVYVAVTRNPTQAWTAPQLRNATPFDDGPRFVLRDRDDKFGELFDSVAEGVGARILRTPVRSPRANAEVERFLWKRQARVSRPSDHSR
jgi:putative transposase